MQTDAKCEIVSKDMYITGVFIMESKARDCLFFMDRIRSLCETYEYKISGDLEVCLDEHNVINISIKNNNLILNCYFDFT